MKWKPPMMDGGITGGFCKGRDSILVQIAEGKLIYRESSWRRAA